MTVYLRTGEGSAVSFPLWLYVFAVLPLQLLWIWAKLTVVLLAALSIGVFVAARWTWRQAVARRA
jgi:hypothetical protein